MKTRKLLAIRPHKYGTRHLVAGDEYDVPPRHAVALVAARRARFNDKGPFQTKPAAKLAPPPPQSEAALEPKPVAAMTTETDKLEALRMEAWRLGVSVDGRWGMARLQHEIAQARR
jgi:hypothetical protein